MRSHLEVAMSEITVDRLRAAAGEVLRDVPEVAAAYAYGSRIRGRALPLSDLDFAVVLATVAHRVDPLLAERISSRIATRLGSPVEIDAHVADDLPLPVRGRVVTTGVLVYERDPVRRVEFETATRRLYFDFLPLLERDARDGIRSGG